MTTPKRFETSEELVARVAYETRCTERDARFAAAIAGTNADPIAFVPSWRWLTETEAATRWRIAPRTMRRRRVAWQIPATKVGKSWLYHPVLFERVDAIVMAMFAHEGEDAEDRKAS